MELALLGGSVWLAKQYMPNPKDSVVPDEEEEIMEQTNHDEFLYKQFRQNGMIAQKEYPNTGRLPFTLEKGPFSVFNPRAMTKDGHMENATQYGYDCMINLQRLKRIDAEEQIAGNEPMFIDKRGGAIPQLFTREIYNPANPRQATSIVDWSWVPRNPTDSDFDRVGRLAKHVPLRPDRFAPDGAFMAAPGQQFRHYYNRRRGGGF